MADVEQTNNGTTTEAIAVDPAQAVKRKLTEDVVETPVVSEDKEAAAAEDTAPPAAKKSRVDAEPPTKLESEIIRQIEYYFGDANLFRDKFLQTEVAKDEGWVPLTTMLTFKRLAALSSDAEVIVAALDKSDEGLVEISGDRQRIRRHPERPLPEKNEETRKEIITRTAYVKGFGLESEMAAYIEFFDAYPKVTNIVVRKFLHKPTKEYKPKGSAFVTFATVEQCDAFLKVEKVEFKGNELEKKWQSEYYTAKKAERSEKTKDKKVRFKT